MRTSPFAAGTFIPTSRLQIPPDVESTPSVGHVKSQFHGSQPSGEAEGCIRFSALRIRMERADAAKELDMSSDGAPRIWKAREEGFAGQTAAFILGQFRALQHAAAAVIAVTPDRAN